MLLMILMVKKLMERFVKKTRKKQINRIWNKVIKVNGDNDKEMTKLN